MSNDRDIDDILDSLNQLLREGESHNDDHVEPDKPIEEIGAELHAFAEASADEVEAGAPEAETLDKAAGDEVRDVEPESAEAEVRQQDEAVVEGDDEAGAFVDAPVSIQRVILTEEMLVDNPQGNLLSLVHTGREESADSAVEPEPVAEDGEEHLPDDAHAPLHVDHQHMERLLEQVTDDVIHQLQQQLPSLIKTSLYRQLQALKSEPDKSEE